jgi:hypothetical protein
MVMLRVALFLEVALALFLGPWFKDGDGTGRESRREKEGGSEKD